jgi:hypothetical protein
MQQSSKGKCLVLVASMLALFFLLSVVHLPVPRRGMIGAGLYGLVDELRLSELFVGTLLGVLVVARLLCFRWAVSMLTSLAAALINLALLIADVRMHSYSNLVESQIAHRFGSPLGIWVCCGVMLVGGGFCAGIALRLHVADVRAVRELVRRVNLGRGE